MSFMSFQYAQQAADAALQFHQGQGQKVQEVNSQMRDTGTRNANSKDETMRQKIQAEYEAKSAEIKQDKLEQLAQIKHKQFQNATLAQFLVGGGVLAGGIIDGMMDTFGKDKSQAPDISQMNVDSSDVEDGFATSFKIASGDGNSEQGAIVAFDRNNGQFNVASINTSTGQVRGFVNVSANQMAENIVATLGDEGGSYNEVGNDNNASLMGMINAGPPARFKEEFLSPGENGMEMKPELQAALFGENGFFNQTGAAGEGSEAGENMVRDMLGSVSEFPMNAAYTQTANSIVSLLENDKIQGGLGITDHQVGLAKDNLRDSGIAIGGWDKLSGGAGTFVQKAIVKPLGESLNQFMKMAQVTRGYEEEYQNAMAEYEAAKKAAAAAREKLQKLESLLAAGSST